jgi:linoleoyl-CoA desaturase
MTPKFPAVQPSLHAELRRRVQAYFEENKILPTGNLTLYTKAVILVVLFWAVYIHVLFFTPAWYIAIPECLLLGALAAGIGFNVMHDGSHGSFSKYPWLNRLASYCSSMLGAHHFMWDIKHNMIHHSYTNIDGVDDDIEVGILMRLAPTQKHFLIHKAQHVYFWVLYMLLYIFWIFFADFKKYFTGKIGSVPLKKMNWRNHTSFWAIKVYHIAMFVVIPIAMLGFMNWMIGFLSFTLVAGFILSIVFQLAHTVADTEFPEADPVTQKMPDEFAIHQIKTTANFATRNKVIGWLVGGLNFQIEHHLFPKISHVHYPAISQIVKKVCAEYNLPYIEYPTMRTAIVAHVSFLREMGKPSHQMA